MAQASLAIFPRGLPGAPLAREDFHQGDETRARGRGHRIHLKQFLPHQSLGGEVDQVLAQVAFSPFLAAKPVPELLPAGVHQRGIQRGSRQHAAEKAPVRLVLRGQGPDESQQARRLRVAVGRGERRLRNVPLQEIRFQEPPQQVFLGRVVVGDPAPRDAAFLDEFVEGERTGAIALDDLPGGGEDFLAGEGRTGHFF